MYKIQEDTNAYSFANFSKDIFFSLMCSAFTQ